MNTSENTSCYQCVSWKEGRILSDLFAQGRLFLVLFQSRSSWWDLEICFVWYHPQQARRKHLKVGGGTGFEGGGRSSQKNFPDMTKTFPNISHFFQKITNWIIFRKYHIFPRKSETNRIFQEIPKYKNKSNHKSINLNDIFDGDKGHFSPGKMGLWKVGVGGGRHMPLLRHWSAENPNFKVVIEECLFRVRRVNVAPSVIMTHSQSLQQITAKNTQSQDRFPSAV
jgi:hypothetical protein